MNKFSENEMNNISGGGFYEGPTKSYTVLPGEKLEDIERKFGVKTGVLLELNYPLINDSLEIKAGMVIQVPSV